MSEAILKDEVDFLIESWDGNIKALISQLLEERQMLIKQIEVSACALSTGYVRGWKASLPEH